MAGKGQGERSGLGHVVLVEVRYKSVKNHLNCQNSCGESGAVRGHPNPQGGDTCSPPAPTSPVSVVPVPVSVPVAMSLVLSVPL